SISLAGLTDCGGLNILVGRNNAGKSNLLAALALVLRHFQGERVVGPWPTRRAQEEFLDRDDSQAMRIGVELDLNDGMRNGLHERLLVEAPHLERSIDQIMTQSSLTVIVTGARLKNKGAPFLFVQQMTIGALNTRDDDLVPDGIRLLSVPNAVGPELFERYLEAQQLASDLSALIDMRDGRTRQGFSVEALFNQPKEVRPRYTRELFGLPSGIRDQVAQMVAATETSEEFGRALADLLDDIRKRIGEASQKETTGTLSTFAGEARRVPLYVE